MKTIILLLSLISIGMADEFFDTMLNGDYKKAEKIAIEKCNKGDGIKCALLMDWYREGIKEEKLFKDKVIIHKNPYKVKEYAKKACNYGIADGCMELGGIYSKGDIVKYDPQKAVELYIKACEMKKGLNFLGCYNAGVQYYNLNHLPEAKKYFGLACDKGYKEGCKMYKKISTKGIK